MNSPGSDPTDKNHKKDNDDNRIRDSKFNENNSGDDIKNKKTEASNESRDKSIDPRFRRLVWYLIASTRGGINRAKIIDFLADNPSNANQLASQLKLDYKTIVHHLEVLKKNGLVVTENEDSYGATYFISPLIEKNYSAFREIMAQIGKK
ncbi:MAG: winged helix-turn-helix domain-containing protein [Candidatus Nitrosocosmicus sp.]|nr:winged helix-turn-helix domain-containing protein [Candidatus Nitrosocosmicus sp.]